MQYTIIRKMYRSTRDMNPDNPCKISDIWVGCGCDPLTLEEAQIVLPKMMQRALWINEIKAI